MRRTLRLFLLLSLVIALLLPAGAALASEEDTDITGTYFGTTFESGSGTYSSWDGDYILLNEDGTGVQVHHYLAYTITWVYEDDILRFVNNAGDEYSGGFEDGELKLDDGYQICGFLKSGVSARITKFAPDRWQKGLPHVCDQADILSYLEEQELCERADEIADETGIDVYIVTVDDLNNFTDAGRVETLTEELRCGYGLARDNDDNMILLLLSMEDRDFDLMAHGTRGNAAFTDYGKEQVQKAFLDDFKENDWFGGFEDYLDKCDSFIHKEMKGNPVDVEDDPSEVFWNITLSGAVAFILALIIASIVKAGMKSARIATEANAYIDRNVSRITYRSDAYSYTTTSRVYSPIKSSGGGGGGRSGGGGGTSIGHSGSSHSSGKF